MPVKRRHAKETKTPYRTKRKTSIKPPVQIMLRWADIESATEPIILERDGQPAAVVIRYADYQQMDAASAVRREAAWRELDTILDRIHARTQDFSAEEIKADIAATVQEVREQRHAAHHHGTGTNDSGDRRAESVPRPGRQYPDRSGDCRARHAYCQPR